MRVGVQLPEVERVVRWPEIAAMARTADASGFDSIWLGDHLLYRGDDRGERGPWDAWTQLAALAVVTSRVRLGPLVAAAAFYVPGVLARMAASVDEISGGRLILGIGAGWNQAEFAAFGLPFDRLGSRFEESFTIVRRLLAGEHVTFEGEFHRVRNAVLLPVPSRRIPLMIGSSGPHVLRSALPHVEWWNVWYSLYGNTADGFAARNAEVDATCGEVGRDRRAVRRSACVLVAAGSPSERRHDAPAVPISRLVTHLGELAQAGADEAILILDPINERSIREAAGQLS